MRVAMLVLLLLLPPGIQAETLPCDAAPASLILIRHAEKVDEGPDSALTTTGWLQAVELVGILRDREIDAVFSTPFQRTRHTALPIAMAWELKTIELEGSREGMEELLRRLCADYPGKTVVVVGHSNTLPEILRRLGVEDPPGFDYADVYEAVLGDEAPVVRRLDPDR